MGRVIRYAVRSFLWMLTHDLPDPHRRARARAGEGPALIISNHISMIDGALVGASIHRTVRFWSTDPISGCAACTGSCASSTRFPSRRATAGRSCRRSSTRAELAAGHVVCIFAEGAVTRTGSLLPFKRGFERIVEGLDVPVIPIYLDRVWGSIFSYKGGKFFWKLPERLPCPVTVVIGQPLRPTVSAAEAGWPSWSLPQKRRAIGGRARTCCTRIHPYREAALAASAIADSMDRT